MKRVILENVQTSRFEWALTERKKKPKKKIKNPRDFHAFRTRKQSDIFNREKFLLQFFFLEKFYTLINAALIKRVDEYPTVSAREKLFLDLFLTQIFTPRLVSSVRAESCETKRMLPLD